jgi:hypothetical protein
MGEVGPGSLQAIATIGLPTTDAIEATVPGGGDEPGVSGGQAGVVIGGTDGTVVDAPSPPTAETGPFDSDGAQVSTSPVVEGDLIERARQEDARHWAEHQRPISAETLRRRLRIGAARSRMLVSIIRTDQAGRRSSLVDAAAG